MRTATRLQLFRFKCVTIVQQEYHKNISSSRGFCRFFERKCKKVKISRSEIVSQVQQVHPRYRKFVTSVLHFTVSRIVLSHLTCCILFFTPFCSVFHAFFCMFIYLYAYFKVQQTFVCAFPFHSPPAALFWAAAGLWLYFLQQKTAQAAFSGPSVLCRIPYIKRRAAPKSRPPTIQAML